jgi:hypothetical protein
MGQAGIGTINQAQVSNYCPVPPNTVIAQPQMLFLFFDQNLNGPSLEITADNFLHRQTDIIRNQCNNSSVVSAFGKNNFNSAKFIHRPNTLSKFVTGCFSQPFNAVPSASSVQNIPAVLANFVFDGIYSKPSIRLANADITPFPLFACIDESRTKIERIKQDGYIEVVRYFRTENDLSSQFCEFLKLDIKPFGMFFLDIQPRAQRYGYSSVEQTGFDNCMPHAVFSGGMMMDLTDSLHFFSPLDRLRIINDEQTVFASFFEEFFEHPHGLSRNDSHLIKLASPEKFTMVGSMCAASKKIDKPLNGAAMTDADGNHEIAIVVINVSREIVFDRLEKRFDFLRNFADSNHTASLLTSYCSYNTYRQERLFLFNHHYHPKSFNRSV